MEIEIGLMDGDQEKVLASVILTIVTLVGLALLRRAVIPVEAREPAILTPERWQAAAQARRARAETAQLQRDAMALRALLERPDPDPVQAMLLAQRVYAHHRCARYWS